MLQSWQQQLACTMHMFQLRCAGVCVAAESFCHEQAVDEDYGSQLSKPGTNTNVVGTS
jgi:hypothetical protein